MTTTNPNEVLLVEDNETDITLAQEAFAECGIADRVRVVRDGAAALDQLLGPGASGPLPRLVLLDLRLPKVEGLEVLRRLRADARTLAVPVVVMSTSIETGDVAAAYELHCNAFVQKAMSLDAFISAIRTIKEFFLDLNVTPSR